MLFNAERAVAVMVAFLDRLKATRPRNLEEAIAQGEAEAAEADKDGWIQIAGARPGSWMRQLRGTTSGPDW